MLFAIQGIYLLFQFLAFLLILILYLDELHLMIVSQFLQFLVLLPQPRKLTTFVSRSLQDRTMAGSLAGATACSSWRVILLQLRLLVKRPCLEFNGWIWNLMFILAVLFVRKLRLLLEGSCEKLTIGVYFFIIMNLSRLWLMFKFSDDLLLLTIIESESFSETLNLLISTVEIAVKLIFLLFEQMDLAC